MGIDSNPQHTPGNKSAGGPGATVRRAAGLVVVGALVATAIMNTWNTDSAAIDSAAAAVEAPVAAPTPAPAVAEVVVDYEILREPAGPGIDPAPVAPPAEPILIADPRDGDLRIEAEADVLPATYAPPVAASTFLDVAYGDDPAQRLDVFLPEADDAPVVVYVHSGGWIGGDKQYVPSMVMRFVERGFAVVSVGYRLAPDHVFPAPVNDVKTAIRWVKAFGDETGSIDSDRLVLYGASAGGHLVTFVAATPGLYEPADLTPELAAYDATAAAVVSMVGPSDLVSFYPHDNAWAAPLTEAFLGCSPCSEERLAAASPITHLHADLPPAHFVYGVVDDLINVDTQAVTIATAWAAAGDNPASIDLVDGLGHNLDGQTVNQRAIENFVDAAVTGTDNA